VSIVKYPKVDRKILLNPGPATTTDTVKYAQIVPDICPREKEFGTLMKEIGEDLIKIVHGDPQKYVAVLFCGSGTLNIDASISSLLPAGKKILVLNNGAYSSRAADVCRYYHLDMIEVKKDVTKPVDLEQYEKILAENSGDVAVVYFCHHETGTGVLNPIREIGAIAHKYGAISISDTTASYAMIPIELEKDNVDFVMASAQKGICAMTGLSFIVGNKAMIEASKDYPTRSYYTNLYLQYSFIRDKGEMHFTPPVQTVYATRQALKEYWQEGEQKKWERHQALWKEIVSGLKELGFTMTIPEEYQSRLVVSVDYPKHPNWSFSKIHDYCYKRGFTIYPGKVTELPTFRSGGLGVLSPEDIKAFFKTFRKAMEESNIPIPVNR
jgi:2-aminoethylphosphonate-pyruvate transaminase